MKNRMLKFVGLLAAVAILAGLSCWTAGHFMRSHPEGRPHDWVHQELKLTSEQTALLVPMEARHAEAVRQGKDAMRRASDELARAILADREDSPRIRASVEQIHVAMGDLQKATLGHIFEMKAVLTPEQYQKLLELTVQGLHEANAD
jgi:nickel and cobalt resistance protein CnrR